jgi:hypothetical protein
MPRRGAYGLTLAGLLDGSPELPIVPANWPDWTLNWCRSESEISVAGALRADDAELPVHPVGRALLSRVTHETCLMSPEQPSREYLLHPLLTGTAAVANAWLGRDGFHSGAIVIEGRAWGILGDKGAGKSTLLAAAALSGVPVLTDDLLILDEDQALAGPRILDLRREAADFFGVGEDLGVVGLRERWRLRLPDVEAAVPFGGWVVLAWGPAVRTRQLDSRSRLAVVAGQSAVTGRPPAPLRLLELAAKPTVVFSRPRRWDEVGDSLLLLRQELARLAP